MSSPAVFELQKVLAAYSKATNNPALSPGPIDGVVGDKTISAVITVTPMIPSELRAAIALLPVGLAFPDGRKKAVSIITNNAGYISKAIAATAIYRTIQGGGAVTPPITPILVQSMPMTPVSPVSSWAKTPVGIAVIAGGALAALGLTVLIIRSVRA